jgi:predicted RNase H-like HicB family nuclease
MSGHYRVEIFGDDESGAFFALAADLPSCSAAGGTRQEALNELQDAVVSVASQRYDGAR